MQPSFSKHHIIGAVAKRLRTTAGTAGFALAVSKARSKFIIAVGDTPQSFRVCFMNHADERFERIAATIGSGEDAILFRRGMRQHIDDISALRAHGLTWDQIARRLTVLGVRHKRGQAVSAHQLRTEYGRLRADIGLNQADGSSRMPSNLIYAPPMATGPAITSAATGVISEKLAELTRTRVRYLEIDE